MAIRPETVALVDFLNHLVRVDAGAIQALVEQRVPCSERLGKHPTVQVGPDRSGPDGLVLGILGLLNGYCGAIEKGEKAGWGPIAARYERSHPSQIGDLIEFTILPEALDEIATPPARAPFDLWEQIEKSYPTEVYGLEGTLALRLVLEEAWQLGGRASRAALSY